MSDKDIFIKQKELNRNLTETEKIRYWMIVILKYNLDNILYGIYF